MLTDQMRKAGWRECPSDEVRKAWVAKGGAWTYLQRLHDGGLSPIGWHNPDPKYTIMDCNRAGLWRPVSSQTWDYDPRGWGAVVPTKQGLWWRDDRDHPVDVAEDRSWAFCESDGMLPDLVWYTGEYDDRRREIWAAVTDDGHWLAPCVRPG